jgi:hypothetical protein
VYVVQALTGNVVTVNTPLPISFINAIVRCGAIDSQITGWGEIDGEYNPAFPPANIWMCLGSTLGTNIQTSEKLKVTRAVHGGLMLFGARQCSFRLNSILSCGNRVNNLGGALWLFGNSFRNLVEVRSVADCYIGIILDNKSNGMSLYGIDQPPMENVIRVNNMTLVDVAYDITSSFNNAVEIGYADAVDTTGGCFDGSTQVVTPIVPTGNSITIGYEKTPRLPVGNANAGNQISIGGDRQRKRRITLTLAAALNWSGETQILANFVDTNFLVKAGDSVAVTQTAAWPQVGITVFGWCPADNQIQLVFYKNGAGGASVPAGTVFKSIVEGAL